MKYHLYMLKCVDESLYTGITTDMERRLKEHNKGKAAARYTRTRRPVALVYSKLYKDRSSASIAEAQMKKLTKEEKLALIAPAV